MRIFETSDKINFVDNNDVFVGFSNYLRCCEVFGYFFSTDIPTGSIFFEGDGERGIARLPSEERLLKEGSIPPNLDSFVFDPSFFVKPDLNCYEGGVVTFKLHFQPRTQSDIRFREIERQHYADGSLDTYYLTLYNHHNGYYNHGFSTGIGNEVLREGSL
jgi:hypothetical protein